MPDETEIQARENPHLHDPDTGTKHGVPAGVVQEESKGLPESGRHQSESAPVHTNEPANE